MAGGFAVSGFIIYFLCLPSKESNKENSPLNKNR
jgi:hypothetical protein